MSDFQAQNSEPAGPNCGLVPPVDKRDEAIALDFKYVKEFVSPAAVINLNKEFITVYIVRTQYAKVLLRVHFPLNYPNEVAVVELSSATLPTGLMQNKEKECIEMARKCLNSCQFGVIYETVFDFIQTNMFVPCWREMKQLYTLCEGKGKVGIDDKEGVVQLRLNCEGFYQNVKLTVPYTYPEEGVTVELQSSNFPQDIQYMFQSQANEIVRRCVNGCTIEQALQISNSQVISDGGKQCKPQVSLTTDSLKSLKHDASVLKQISDLRTASNSKDRKGQYFTDANAERREARKDLRKLIKVESEADQQKLREQQEAQEKLVKELLVAKVSDVAQPSLFIVTKFLVEEYICKLPVQVCEACKQKILVSAIQSDLIGKSGKSNSRKDMRPIRTFCGHYWLHYSCLNEWLSTPPFIRNCTVCSRRVWHPDWPEDYKQLERAWQAQEARKREMADVSDFMGMSEEFSSK